MGRELVGKRTRKGTEANLMRCDKEWKGGGEGEGEGGGGGGGECFTSIGCARSWAKGSIGGSLPLCGSLAFHVVFRLIRN